METDTVGLVFVVPLLISADDVRNKLFAEIESATGYRLTVSGPLHISAFPTLKLVAEDVGVAQNTGADDAVDLATAKELHFGLALAPLFSGRVQVTEIALLQPVVRVPEPAAKAGATAANGGARTSGTSLATLLNIAFYGWVGNLIVATAGAILLLWVWRRFRGPSTA